MSRTSRTVRSCAALGVLAVAGGVLSAAPAAGAVTPVASVAVAAAAPTSQRIDAGGPGYPGTAWTGDRGAVGGRVAVTRAPIAGTTADAVYRRQRVGMRAYRLPVPNGVHAVTLHFAEPYFAKRGKRVFDVQAEGRTVASRLDVFAAARGKNRALEVTRRVTVSDGRLDLGFRARVNAPLVAGISTRLLAAAPGSPRIVAVQPTAVGTATLGWAPPAVDGGAPVTAYRVIRTGTDSTGAGAWSTVLPGTARSFRFEKLSPETTYDFIVYGRNAVGASEPVRVRVTTPEAASGFLPTSTDPVPTPSSPTPESSPAPVSGLTWPSGVYVPGSTPAKHEAFAAWRGRALDVAVDWPARATWSDIVNPGWLYDRWSGTPYTKVFGVAMVPEQDSTATIATCASGAHNARWVEFGRNIRARGLDDETIVRLGWEFNGDWYKWAAKDPVAWVQCWRNIVTSAESTAPALRWDWTTNRGPGQSLTDPTLAYPGDAYVDIVGVDSYDGWPGAVDETTWQSHYSGAYGLKFWADFARAHGKKLSVPEWGVYPGTAWAGHNGGDNPFYIAKMVGFFRSQASNLAYEAYFNEPASYYAGSMYGPVQAPRASAEYSRLY